MKCPHCNTENQEADRFCVECGQPLHDAVVVAKPHRPRRRRRWPWFLALILLLLIGAAAVALYFELLPLPPQIASLIERGPEVEAPVEILGTEEPFLVLQIPGETDLEVILTDLNGDILATIGPHDGAENALLLLEDPEYDLWAGVRPLPPAGAAAVAWPATSVTLIALHTLDGWDLLRYDAAKGEMREFLNDVESVQVVGHVAHDRFLAHYVQNGRHSLVGGDRDRSEAIEFVEGAEKTTAFVISPDGKYAAFHTDDLYIVGFDGLHVYRQPEEYSYLVFSPDSRYLLYSSGYQLIRADADGRNPRIISEVGRNDKTWALSASRSHLAVQQNVGDTYDVRVLTWDGTTVTRLGRADSYYRARYLPAQQGLLIMRSGPSGEMELADPSGENRRLVADGVFNFAIYPARDDRHLALAYEQEEGWQLSLYDLREDEDHILERDLSDLWLLAVNDRHLVYAARPDDRWLLMTTDLRNGETRQLDSGARGGYPIAFFTPNGERILYEARDDTVTEMVIREDGTSGIVYHLLGGVYAVDLKDPMPREVYEGAHLLAASLAH